MGKISALSSANEAQTSEAGFFQRFSITTRLLMVVGLLCLAYPFVVFLLVLEQNRAMDFARKEILGSDYLARSTPQLLAIARKDIGLNNPPKLPQSLTDFHSQWGSTLDVENQFQDMARMDSDAFAHAMALNKRVGDQSNLILDPDLDSYYLMDVILLRIPDLVRITRNLELARKADDEFEIRTQQTLLDASLISIRESMDTAFEENARTAELLGPSYKAFQKAAQDYRQSEGRNPVGNWFVALEDFFQPTNQELKRLLEVRIQGFLQEQMMKLGAIGLALLFAFLVLWRVVRSIVGPVRAMESRMHDLSQGEGDLTFRLESSSTNEIGRSAGYFNQFAEKLANTVRGIGKAAVSLEENGNSSMGTVDMISSGLQEQAASLEEISASMEEVSASADRVNTSMDEEKVRLAELQKSMAHLRNLSDTMERQIRDGSSQAQTLAEKQAMELKK